MKATIGEIYGEGTFYEVAGKEIVNLFPKVDSENATKTISSKVGIREELTQKSCQDNGTNEGWLKYKSFAAVVANGNKGFMNGKDVLPLKPLSIPRIEGGNVVVEIEDKDYQQE